MKKISLIGAGQIGGTLAHLIGTKEVADEVVLFDVASGIAKGKALDIAQSSSVDGFNVKFSGTDNYEDIKDSDVIIITAGVPRKPGMSRDDLLGINLKIIKQVAEGIKKNAPNAFVICITNPLDVMVMAFQKFSGLPANKVVGMAGILDSSRFKLFLSLELNVPVKEIEAMVMGGHGDTMVPLPRFTKVSGKPLLDLVKEGKISPERLEEINQRTRDGGAEIVKYLEKGSAFYAPAASGVQMAEAYLKDEKKLLPCAVHLNGEYGVSNVYAGVPVIIGKDGVEKIEQIDLDEKEKKEFMHSIDAVKALWEAASKIDPDLSKYMNIHEHQAKQILKKYGAVVPEGVFAFTVDELIEKAKSLKTEKFVLKAQIHAGGRGKAGGVKILDTIDELGVAAKELLGKTLVTHQTGPEGREVKRLYVEESSNIDKEFYLSCLIDRASSKIVFISSDQGGMDIEEVADSTPEKIITTKVDIVKEISDADCEKIIKIYSLTDDAKKQAIALIKSVYNMFLGTDANMVEVNPLILTKEKNIICLDAKVNFDSNALFRHPEIIELRDLNEEDPAEIDASKHDLAYIKLDGSIGCMVNGAGLSNGNNGYN